MTFVILTSKPGKYRTEAGDDLRPVEAYDYVAHGRNRAHFVIAEFLRETRVRIVDEGADGTAVVNNVPSKFFPRFDTLEEARRELRQLANPNSPGVALIKT